MFIWVNGEYMDESKPIIQASDKGFQYGYGLYENIRIYPDYKGFGRAFQIDEHIHRLSMSAKKLKIPLSISYRSFNKAAERLIKLNDKQSGYLRITLSAGSEENKSICVIETLTIDDYKEAQEKGVKITISPYKRSVESPLCQHKTLNYLEPMLFRNQIKNKNIFEVVFLNTKDEVTEGTISNIFTVQKGRILTPPLSVNILPGIARKIIFGLCTGNNFKIREKPLKEDDLRSAEEVFLTSSLTEVVPVVRIDSDKIGDGSVGPVTKILQSAYIRLTESID